MPFTYNGFGTMFYGEGDRREDGSFISTEWITAAYVPLIPLKSFRLVRCKEADAYFVIVHSEGYQVLEKLSICWPQVLRIYSFLAIVAVWWSLAIWICFTKFDIATDSRAPWIVSTWVLAMAAPFFVVWLIRRETYMVKYGRPNPESFVTRSRHTIPRPRD
jgi:hypothetical protein